MSEVGVSKGTWEFFVNCSVNFKEIKKTLKKVKLKQWQCNQHNSDCEKLRINNPISSKNKL